jgi:hypothetical protein
LCLLFGLIASTVASSSSGTSSSSNSHHDDDDDDTASGVLRAALVDRAKNPTVKLQPLNAGWRNDDDDDGDDDDSEDDDERRKARDERRIAAAIARAAVVPPTPRSSYQAKFSRDTAALCVFDANFPRNGTQCTLRENGPVLFIAKTSAAPVTADSFDGNLDGKDDVKAAYDNLFAGAGGPQFETLINQFLLQIRNRAGINGGSIKLSALILTGRRPNGNFASFGPNGDIMFSPCFPVIQNPAYNIDLYGISRGLNTLFTLNVAYANFVNAGLDASVVDDTFLPRVPAVGTFPLIAQTFDNPDPLKVDAAGVRLKVTNMKVGDVIFEKCTQFSYFQ